MPVLQLERNEVPRFLMSASLRVASREPKSVFGYFDNETNGVFVTSCSIRVGLDGELEFSVEGVTFEGRPAHWAGRVNEITIQRLEDAGYIFTTGIMPELTLYL